MKTCLTEYLQLLRRKFGVTFPTLCFPFVEVIDEQNDANSGYKVPPVLPHELVKLCSCEFNEIVTKQTRQFLTFKTADELEITQEQHCELISTYRSEEPLCDAIKNSTFTSSFKDGWKFKGVLWRFGYCYPMYRHCRI